MEVYPIEGVKNLKNPYIQSDYDKELVQFGLFAIENQVKKRRQVAFLCYCYSMSHNKLTYLTFFDLLNFLFFEIDNISDV